MTEPNGISRDELLKRLREAAVNDDIEEAHIDADDALIAFINDPEIKAAYDAVHKWHS